MFQLLSPILMQRSLRGLSEGIFILSSYYCRLATQAAGVAARLGVRLYTMQILISDGRCSIQTDIAIKLIIIARTTQNLSKKINLRIPIFKQRYFKIG